MFIFFSLSFSLHSCLYCLCDSNLSSCLCHYSLVYHVCLCRFACCSSCILLTSVPLCSFKFGKHLFNTDHWSHLSSPGLVYMFGSLSSINLYFRSGCDQYNVQQEEYRVLEEGEGVVEEDVFFILSIMLFSPKFKCLYFMKIFLISSYSL